MIHYLPTIRSEKEGFNELTELAADSHDLFNDQLQLNFPCCGLCDANMAAALAAILAQVVDQFNTNSSKGTKLRFSHSLYLTLGFSQIPRIHSV
jgi:hypothetical protein